MAIEVREGRYFSRFFCADVVGANLMGALYRDDNDEDDEDWKLLFRLRIHVDDKIHDSADERRWWIVKIRNRTPLRAAFDAKRAMLAVTFALGGHDLEEVVVDSGDPFKVLEIMAAIPWLHFERVENAKT